MHLTPRWIRLHGFTPGIVTAAPAANAVAADATAARNDAMAQALQFAWDCGEKFGWDRIRNHLLLAVAASLVLLWPIARMIVGPQRILIRTILFVGSTLALTAAFLALGHFAIRADSILLLAAVVVAFSAIVLTQTRHLFAASHGAAAGVIGCFAVLLAGASYSTEMLTGAMPWTTFAFKPKEEQQRLFADWQTQKTAPALQSSAVATAAPGAAPSAAPAATPNAVTPDAANVPATPSTPVLPQRAGPNLDALYAQLQKTRAELDMNDAQAVARFNEQAAAYAQERALAAATAAPPSVPAKADAAPSIGRAAERQSSQVATGNMLRRGKLSYRSFKPWRFQKLCSAPFEPLKTFRSSGRSTFPK